MKQITREQAQFLYDSQIWETWTDKELVEFQLYQKHLAVGWSRFHKSVEAMLDRPVFVHEFAHWYELRLEYELTHGIPSPRDILEMIPQEWCSIVESLGA